MDGKIKTRIAKLAKEADIPLTEVSEDEATYKSSEGTLYLNPGYVSETTPELKKKYFKLEEKTLQENLEKLNLLLRIKQTEYLNIIRYCVVFFTVLLIIGLVIGIIYGIKLGDAIKALQEAF